MTTNCQEIRKCVRPTKINNDFVCKLDVNRQSFDWLQNFIVNWKKNYNDVTEM